MKTAAQSYGESLSPKYKKAKRAVNTGIVQNITDALANGINWRENRNVRLHIMPTTHLSMYVARTSFGRGNKSAFKYTMAKRSSTSKMSVIQ